MMNRHLNTILLLAVILAFIIRPSPAISDCTISATSIAFGRYDIFSNSPLDSVGTISLSCTSDVVKANMTMGASSASGTINPRKMKRSAGSDYLEYNIFVDVTRTAIFGDGTGGTTIIELRRPTGKPAPWTQYTNIYGRIPPGQDVFVGSYSDSLTVTINW